MNLIPRNYKMVLLASVVLITILSSCSVPKGVIELQPVIDKELYELGPYEK